MPFVAVHDELVELVGFRLSGRRYAVDIRKVREIDIDKEITPIPNAPEYIEGAINIRGKVIPVINPRRRFALKDDPPVGPVKIIVMNVKGIAMGFLVDAISDVLRVPRADVLPLPPISFPANTGFIQGIVRLRDGLVILLDMDRLLRDEEFSTLFEYHNNQNLS